MDPLARIGRRLEREILARLEAERLLEEKSRELYEANSELSRYATELGEEVGLKARELLVAQRVARLGTLIYNYRENLWRFSEGLYLLFGRDPRGADFDIDQVLREVHPEDLALAESVLKPMLGPAGAGSSHVELVRFLLPNGALIWTEIRSELSRYEGGEPCQLVCTVQDITQQKQTEISILESRMQIALRVSELEKVRAELEQARDDAQRSSRIKSRFLAIMSHEIRTPLNGVFGALQLMSDGGLDPERQELVELALKSAEDLQRVTNDVIDMSRLEADQIVLEPEVFDFVELTGDLCEFWQPVAQAKGVALQFEMDEGMDPVVRSDSGRIRQVINNLLSNAIKFSDAGTVALKISTRATDAVDVTRYRVEVIDQGIGMSESKLARMLSSQEDEDVKLPERGGAGLGLAICQALIRRMDGEFGAASDVGRGTRVWFELPLVRVGEDERPERKARSGPRQFEKLSNGAGEPPRILFVDDSVPNQMIGQSMLRRFGCIVDVASNGWEAVNAVTEKAFDAVLMDVSMPVMDGVEATQTIRALDDLRAAVPIVGQTAFAMTEEVAAFLASGMNEVIHKPLQMDQMYEALARQLQAVPVEPEKLAEAEPAQTTVQVLERLDLDVLAEMCESIPPEMLDSLFEHVQSDLKQHSSAAAEAMAAGDLHRLSRAAHALKGLSAGFGCPGLEKLARELEQSAKREAAGECEMLTPTLVAMAGSAGIALEEYRIKSGDSQHA